MNKLNFTFSDSIAGYVTKLMWEGETFVMKTSDERTYEVKLTSNTYAEIVRNLGENFSDCTAQIKDMLEPGRFLHAYGVYYPEGADYKFEAKHIVMFGRSEDEFKFEKPDWWVNQIKSLGEFYLKAQFADGNIDYTDYTTYISLYGEKLGTAHRQETDTISRLIYGFATAYMMTGDDRFIEAAEKGTKYLRDHMRSVDSSENIAFWYHGIEKKGGKERKIFASEFGDDYDAIPAYEQIYALAGPTQTFRVTGDKEIANDIDMTVNLFERYFLDKKGGGYYSHIDPVTFDARSESLGRNRCRKNWNSIGDHTPAYLINAYLATGDERYANMLKYTGDIITKYFQDYENSPFVQEKFHEDWSHDKTWGWQQDRGVIGHNLKIAWNLMRLISMNPQDSYMEFSRKIADTMPEVGGDQQRGGWYDVMDRNKEVGQEKHRFAWHDRKAWWQQEQGILAYLILAGITKDPKYLKLARESSAFYNAWFLDHDSGAVYFNVMANGIPYLLGNERMKGSHSMSGYHSFELAYLASVYTNLLITKQPMDFYFRPYPNSFKDNILRVSPDILPKDSIYIESVLIDDKEYTDFDAKNLTVKLPDSAPKDGKAFKVKVKISPAGGHSHFNVSISESSNITSVKLSGILDSTALLSFRKTMIGVVSKQPQAIEFDMTELESLSSEGARVIIFESSKLDLEADIAVKGARDEICNLFKKFEFAEKISFK